MVAGNTVIVMVNDRPRLTRSSLGSIDQWLEAARTDGAIALIDKEEDWTSFDCVAKLRNRTRVKRVGHAGTLDPLATGLLVICFGKATKDIAFLQDDDKTYDVEFRFGARSTTDDRAGDVTETADVTPCTEEQVVAALRSFEGTIQQTPPDYSAIRHQGRRQYDLAREGKEFTPKTRTVRIDPITNIEFAWPLVRCTISCSKGTYIRSIARDCGEILGCGAYVTKLRRTRSGGFTIDDACTVGEVIDALPQGVTV